MRNSSDTSQGLDIYLKELYKLDENFDGLLKESRFLSDKLNKTSISLSKGEGKILSSLVAAHNCKSFVEVGTLTGYSALWILQGLADNGELFTCEKDDRHAQAALSIFEKFHTYAEKGLPGFKGKRAHLFEGDAEETLKQISEKGPFDGIFIDGNKAAYCRYLDWAEVNLKKGGIIIGDNVFCGGAVWGNDPSGRFTENQARVMREFNSRLADPDKYLSAIWLPKTPATPVINTLIEDYLMISI